MAKVELLARTQNRQALEMSALRTHQLDELRNEARQKGVLVLDPKELNPGLNWKMGKTTTGSKVALGENPETKASVITAYYCEHCGGWVEGAPKPEKYNDIEFLSGSAGVKFNCNICDLEIGRRVTMVS